MELGGAMPARADVAGHADELSAHSDTALGGIAETANIKDYYVADKIDVANATDPERNATEKIDPFYFYETEQFTVLWLLFVVIVAGNTAVLANLMYGKRRKSRMNFFIKQLAFADLLVGLISVLTDIVWRYSVGWYAGNAACKIIKFMQVLVTYSSTYVLVALSIDRYDAITRPMNFSRSWCRARALIASAWGISVVFSIPILFLYKETMVEDKLQCWIDLGAEINWRIYMSLVSLTLFAVPAVVITGCYMVIVWTIWTQSNTLRQDSNRDTRRVSSRGLIPRAKIKTVKMTFVIVFVFIICWSPYIVFDLLQVYGQIPRSQTSIAVATFIQSLAPLNSAANPIIYCLFSTPFCKTIRNMPAVTWFSSLCPKNTHHCFGSTTASNNTRTTVTTSLTAQSSRRSGPMSILQPSSRKRVMVSIV